MIQSPSISLCLFVHNDLKWLRATLPYEMRWADEVCILDMGSTDGTQEFCELFLRPQDRYKRRKENTCPELGFAEARNAVADMATSDWIFFSAADQVLTRSSSVNIHQIIRNDPGEVLDVECLNVRGKEIEPTTWEKEWLCQTQMLDIQAEYHRRIFKRSINITHRGYIHEEAFVADDLNCIALTSKSTLRMLHFQGSHQDAKLRMMRYYWMFRQALRNPELQKWTNRWWYDVFCVENAAEIERLANEYEKHVKETGQK